MLNELVSFLIGLIAGGAAAIAYASRVKSELKEREKMLFDLTKKEASKL